MNKAIVLHETGGPDVFKWEDVEVSDPGPGEVRLRQTAVGLNFIDTHLRDGSYPLASLPVTLGFEGAGVVEAIGDGVGGISVGDRMGYCLTLGAYAQARNMPADTLVPIPDGISDQEAAAGLLKGMTAEFLLHPGMKLNDELRERFSYGADRLFGVDLTFSHRLDPLFPLFGLRWATIVLNEFVSEDWARRAYARGETDRERVLNVQLEKARALVGRALKWQVGNAA